MIRNSFFLILIAFLLAGCATNVDTSVTPMPSKTPIVVKASASTTTPFSTPIATATPGVNFVQQCLQVDPKEVTLKDVSSGVVFFFPNLLDIQTGRKNRIPAQQAKSDHYGWGQVSPDRKMYAYIEEILNNQNEIINHILWVVDAHAGLLSKFSLNQKDWLGVPRWLDNESLIMETKEYGTLLVVNPFTHEQRVVANELPMLSSGFIQFLWWRVEYSPDLEWVAYFYVEPFGDSGTIVRDVVTKQNLWQSTNGDEGKPAWSPDGQEVAIVGDGQLYLINRSGQAKPVLDKNQPHQTQSPSWSPDGNLIAFWNGNSLMVYDRQADQVIDLCIPGDGENPLPSPLWSPDNRQIVVRSYIAEQDKTLQVLVDLQKKVAYEIREVPDTTILGWMNSLP